MASDSFIGSRRPDSLGTSMKSQFQCFYTFNRFLAAKKQGRPLNNVALENFLSISAQSMIDWPGDSVVSR